MFFEKTTNSVLLKFDSERSIFFLLGLSCTRLRWKMRKRFQYPKFHGRGPSSVISQLNTSKDLNFQGKYYFHQSTQHNIIETAQQNNIEFDSIFPYRTLTFFNQIFLLLDLSWNKPKTLPGSHPTLFVDANLPSTRLTLLSSKWMEGLRRPQVHVLKYFEGLIWYARVLLNQSNYILSTTTL